MEPVVSSWLEKVKQHARSSLTRARLIYTPTVQVHMISQDPLVFSIFGDPNSERGVLDLNVMSAEKLKTKSASL